MSKQLLNAHLAASCRGVTIHRKRACLEDADLTASSLWQLYLALLAGHLSAEGYWLSLQPCHALFPPSCIRLQEPGLRLAFGSAVPFAWRACSQILADEALFLIHISTSVSLYPGGHTLQSYKIRTPSKYAALPHCSYLYSIHHYQEIPFSFVYSLLFFVWLCFSFCFPTEYKLQEHLFYSWPVFMLVSETQKALHKVLWTMNGRKKHVYWASTTWLALYWVLSKTTSLLIFAISFEGGITNL